MHSLALGPGNGLTTQHPTAHDGALGGDTNHHALTDLRQPVVWGPPGTIQSLTQNSSLGLKRGIVLQRGCAHLQRKRRLSFVLWQVCKQSDLWRQDSCDSGTDVV